MIEIRKYKEEYKNDIRKICADTAKGSFAKKPKKREAVCLTYIDYYLEYEPENVFVAYDIETNFACGYIVCSTNSDLYQEKFKKEYLPKIKKNSFILYLFTKICLRVSKKLDEKYSGGFHINIDSNYQGKKIGNLLLTACGQNLISKNVNYMYLVTENRKTRGYGFYMHFGFKETQKYFLGSLCLTYDLKNLANQHGLVDVKE